MGDYKAISDVGNTLIKLLQDNLADTNIPRNSIVLGSPGDVAEQDIRLTLFLYRVVENPFLKNAQVDSFNPLQQPEMSLNLDLYYLLTAYAPSTITDMTAHTMQEHQILGNAMRIFYDNAVLAGSILQGGLAGSDEVFRITLNPLSMDDMNKIWCILPKQNYKLSVGYLVTPVAVDSTRLIDTNRVVRSIMELQVYN